MSDDINVIKAWTDGGAMNPGAGAYGVIIPVEGTEDVVELTKGYKLTTNNRMEMMAVIALLEEFGPNKKFTIHLDSEYTKNGCMFWAPAWERKGWVNRDWKTQEIKVIKNLDLWKRLRALCKVNTITFIKVKAHSGVKYNELADQLCTKPMKNPTEVDQGYLDSLP